MASAVSSVPELTDWAMPSASSASSIVIENEFESRRLVMPRAIGGPAARRLAQSATKASSSPAGTTRLTSPISAASFAEMMSAKSASSLARCMPTRRGRSHEPPKSMVSPRRAKISEKRACSEATMRSQPRARFMPAPTATPFTLAMTGLGMR